MKKSIKILAAALVLGAMSMGLASCGSATTTGIYYSATVGNGATSEDGSNSQTEIYKLEVFSDGTYELTYQSEWYLSVLSLNYGRNVTSYGTYTVTASDDDLGTKTLSLDLPTRIQLCVFHRDGTLLTVDTENWPAGDEANDVAAGIEYTLMERADTETWETAEAFLAAYGRAYTVECDTVKGGMTVTVTGEQIPLAGAVTSAS